MLLLFVYKYQYLVLIKYHFRCMNRIIVAVVVLSGVVTMLFLFLFSVTPATITNIHQQEASAFFHEKLFGGSRNI